MARRVTELVLNCLDPERSSRFWCAALGYVELGREDADIEIGPVSGFGGAAVTIVLARVDEAKHQPLRLHWDVSPVGCSQADELQRLLRLGARPTDVGQAPDASWHVLLDPEGNEFCLLQQRVAQLSGD